jgi:hypothetical protein
MPTDPSAHTQLARVAARPPARLGSHTRPQVRALLDEAHTVDFSAWMHQSVDSLRLFVMSREAYVGACRAERPSAQLPYVPRAARTQYQEYPTASQPAPPRSMPGTA